MNQVEQIAGDQMNETCGIDAVKKMRKNQARRVRKRSQKANIQLTDCTNKNNNVESTPKEMTEEKTEGGGNNNENNVQDMMSKTIAMLSRIKDENGAKPIGALAEADKRWVQLAIAIDSGACDSVIDPGDVPSNVVQETRGSRNGEDYQSATGETIPNLGELHLGLVTREMSIRGMTFTGAPVAKPLGSVKRLCAARHTVVFDEDYSFIFNKDTGELNQLREEEGNYMLDVWVAPPGTTEYDNLSFGRPAP